MAAKMTQDEREYLDRRFEDLDRANRDLNDKLDQALEKLGDLKTAQAVQAAESVACRQGCEARHSSNRARIGKIESNQRWVVLGILAAVGAAVWEVLIPGKK